MIKKFNEYKGYAYYEVNSEEWAKDWNKIKNYLEITDDMYHCDYVKYNELMPKFTQLELEYLLTYIVGIRRVEHNGIISKMTLTRNNSDGSHWYFYKGLDDWYYINIFHYKKRNRYYKCDQWDGFLKFLKDFNL